MNKQQLALLLTLLIESENFSIDEIRELLPYLYLEMRFSK